MHLLLVASFAPSSKALVSNSFWLLIERHLLLVAMHLFLVASFAPSSKALVSNSVLLLLAMHLFLVASCYY